MTSVLVTRRIHGGAAWVVLLLGIFSAKLSYAEEQIMITALPKELFGSWIVRSARINETISRRRSYEFNDPELMGRRFKFGEKEISTNALGARRCVNPKAAKWTSEADKFWGITMGWSGTYPGTPSKVEDFKISLPGNALIDAFILTCGSGYIGPDASADLPPPLNTTSFGTWLILLNNNNMAMKWYDDTILILHREMKRQPHQ